MPNLFNILMIVSLAAMFLCAALTMFLYKKLDIRKAYRELKGLPVESGKDKKPKVNKNSPNMPAAPAVPVQEDDDEEDGADETIALVADENTYNNFKITKRLVVVANIPERID